MSLIFNRKCKIFVGFLLWCSVISVSDGVDISDVETPSINTTTDFCVIDVLGVADNNSSAALEAIWNRVSVPCDAGTYLVANTTECVPCLANNYCPGQTCIFSETTDCGINTCNPTATTSWVSPIGSKSEYDCGRRLHVGNDTIYLHRNKVTTPSLNVQVDGVTFYANLTETQTYMNASTEKKMILRYNNKTYYAYDNTVSPQ